MTAAELLHRTRAAAREYNRAQRVLLAAVGIVIAGLIGILHPRWEESLPGWISLAWLVVFFGLLVFAAVFQAANTRRLNRAHGLCCPKCGKAITGGAALSALSLGTCEACGARVIDPPPPSAAGAGEENSAAPLPPSQALLDRREFPGRLARAANPLGLWWAQPVFVLPCVMLFNRWSLHRLSTAAFTAGMIVLFTVLVLLLRLYWRRLRARYVRLGLCCPQCREPLHPMERALEALATRHCQRCGAAVFPPGPMVADS